MPSICGLPLRKIDDVMKSVSLLTKKYHDDRLSPIILERENRCVNVFVSGYRKSVILPAITRELRSCLDAHVINEVKNDGTGRISNYTAVCLK